MSKSCAVVGGGFQGMIAAYLLKERGFEVTLIEKAPVLGGIMYSWEWQGFNVDKGVHLFDSIPKNLAEIITTVMNGKVIPINFNYASVYNGVTTPGLAIPDLSNLDVPTKSKILYELVEAATKETKDKFSSMFEKLEYLYGKTAAELLDASMKHIYRISSKEVEPESLNQTAYHRLRFLSDEMSLELKKNPILDARVAAMRRVLGKVDDLVSLYPGVGGMRGFCEQMTNRLVEMNVKVLTSNHVTQIDLMDSKNVELTLASNSKIKVDHLFWAQDYATLADAWMGTNEGKKYSAMTHSTPMVIYYFMVAKELINDFTYFHQFTPGCLVFRPSASGLYSQQTDSQGRTYFSAECPTDVGSELWENPEKYSQKVWDECVSMGLLKIDAKMDLDVKIMKTPITHKFNKIGMSNLTDDLDLKIERTNNRIIKPSKKAFTRREIMWAVEECVARMI